MIVPVLIVAFAAIYFVNIYLDGASVTYCHDHLVGALCLCQVIQGVGFPPPLMLIYRGLPPIKLLLFRAFLESFYFVTVMSTLRKVLQGLEKDTLCSLS
jgi:hypothetical protein